MGAKNGQGPAAPSGRDASSASDTGGSADRHERITPPPRDEGPHSWLWKLVFADAERRLAQPGARGERTPAASWLWQGIESGFIWVRHDRTALTFDEADPWLGDLVLAEADRHIAISEELEASLPPDDPRRLEQAGRSMSGRREAIRDHIWRYLDSGWVRVADGADQLLFWNPFSENFEPYTIDLQTAYAELFEAMRGEARAIEQRLASEPYTGPRATHERVAPDPYTGRVDSENAEGAQGASPTTPPDEAMSEDA